MPKCLDSDVILKKKNPGTSDWHQKNSVIILYPDLFKPPYSGHFPGIVDLVLLLVFTVPIVWTDYTSVKAIVAIYAQVYNCHSGRLSQLSCTYRTLYQNLVMVFAYSYLLVDVFFFLL